MDAFAAHPGNHLITLDPDDGELPVVGWVACGQARALPLVLGRFGSLVTGDAVQAESGRVLDLTLGKIFDSAEEWRDYIEEHTPYSAGISNPNLSFPGAVVNVQKPEATPPGEKIASLPKDGSLPPVQFGGKVYAKQTFWAAPPEKAEVVFVLEPQTPCPITGAVKITRDLYYAARKEVTEVHQSAFTKAASDDEPELPLGDGPEEDDDSDDLI